MSSQNHFHQLHIIKPDLCQALFKHVLLSYLEQVLYLILSSQALQASLLGNSKVVFQAS